MLTTVKGKIKKFLRINQGNKNRYWNGRKNRIYYQQALTFAKQYAPDAKTVIDVGPHNTQFLSRVDWVSSKTAIDLKHMPSLPGTNNIQGDFLEFVPKDTFDLVFCLQVLEHLESPTLFAQKLLETGKIVVISVPYQWPPGTRKNHIQDPVDENKLLSWTKKPWLEKAIITDDLPRLVAVFEGTNKN
ncbi:bifunctional 2-polyprenyl-6-hydroxyphenol methylase/3-demethylubiquinol 3-O-methyltransferase UbiG [Pleurocapsa sp. PCC 7319]|uniref:class I SAM-dependent methyltransferase n=1 Tax=Pleurocapsa sp. PCC 7319 TaxID=118161 RepID=UPI00034945A3|nr:methyltransferase domain-containing protein [Pleurocapsa sp. PCC 7319]